MLTSKDDNKLGFGMMRLPVLNDDPAQINLPEVDKMVDLFIDRGFTYFDTSFVYHNGHSEETVRKTVVERHPRDSFTIATKFPTMMVKMEDEVDPYFEQQLKNLGVDYVNFYLLHILMTQYLNNPVREGVVESCHLFDHLVKWQEEGKAKHIGFSFHDSPDVLDKLLTEHPQVEFVQIALNYYDWTSEWVQSKANYEVIRKHDKAVIAMEPVKGGMLADVPEECLKLMHSFDPEATPASWAIRFAASQEGVFKVLSGMSTMAQVQNNTDYMAKFKPLSSEEQEMLLECARIMRDGGPAHTHDFSKYKGHTYHGIPLAGIVDCYNSLSLEPDPSPGKGDDNIYFRQELLKVGVEDLDKEWPPEKVVVDGEDITSDVEKMWAFLVKYAL